MPRIGCSGSDIFGFVAFKDHRLLGTVAIVVSAAGRDEIVAELADNDHGQNGKQNRADNLVEFE